MSYILDALRKADSDRERGAVPGIHTQAAPSVGADSEARGHSALAWAAIVVSALLVAALAWWFFGRAAEPVRPAPASVPPVVATPPAVLPPVLTAPSPKTPTAVAPRAPAAPASVEPRIYALGELPDTIRRELPQLTVGGSIYSDNAANRFLIINGQVFHEGDKLAPDLWLEQIRLKAAVLRYKDYRYTIRF
jgi:general secretion pathway protein B